MNSHRGVAKPLGTAAAVILLAALSAPVILASWSVVGTGSAAGTAAFMPAGAEPVGSVSGSSVAVRWPAVTLSNGAPVAGYMISRFNSVTGAAATVGPGCSGVITTTTCTELLVPAGTWVYADTPVQVSWTGGQSPASAPIVVP